MWISSKVIEYIVVSHLSGVKKTYNELRIFSFSFFSYVDLFKGYWVHYGQSSVRGQKNI